MEELREALAALAEGTFHTYNRWHGAVWPHVADLTVDQALWRPAPGRHSIWEIVRHMTFYHRYVAAWERRQERLDGSQRWSMPERTDRPAWQADLNALEQSYQDLADLLQTMSIPELLQRDERGGHSNFLWIAGLIAHDSYHTGQIAFLRALQGLAPID